MDGAAGNGLVYIEVAIANLEVKAAVGIGADPRLEMNRGALATEVRQRYQVSGLAFLALWEITEIHVSHQSEGESA